MAETISARTCLDAWKAACCKIEADGDINNLLLEITNPTDIDEDCLNDHDPRKFKARVKRSSRDVANTVFPQRTYKRSHTRDELYVNYSAVYARGKRLPGNRSTWGTYFHRMIAFGPTKINRLEAIINAINSWRVNVKTPFVMHLSSTDLDPLRTMSGPCLQYIQFVRSSDGTLDLVVVARNHDYFEKALGNFIGLARLLHFVCMETRLHVGKLICHSVHAYNSASTRALRALTT